MHPYGVFLVLLSALLREGGAYFITVGLGGGGSEEGLLTTPLTSCAVSGGRPLGRVLLRQGEDGHQAGAHVRGGRGRIPRHRCAH